MNPRHLLEDLTFVEFREVARGDPVIVLPFGSQEEQGPACPMGDWMLTRALAERVAREAGAVAAPTIPFGHADYFRSIPGGVQLRAETFAALLRDICDNFLDHGLTKLLVFNGHTGNYPLIDQTIRRIRIERGVIVPCMNVWRSIPDDLWRELHPEAGPAALGHGADPLTSVYLHLFPDLVRKDLIAAPGGKGTLLGLPTSGLDAVKFRGVNINVAAEITDRAVDGIAGGDPRNSSAEIGRRITEHIVELTIGLVRHLQTTDTRVIKPASKET